MYIPTRTNIHITQTEIHAHIHIRQHTHTYIHTNFHIHTYIHIRIYIQNICVSPENFRCEFCKYYRWSGRFFSGATHPPAELHLWIIIFCAINIFSVGISICRSPLATMIPSDSFRMASKFTKPSWFST